MQKLCLICKGTRPLMASTDVSFDGQDVPDMATIWDLSDQDILIKYCLQSKVVKIAINELLKHGYDSLDALKLVNIKDLSNQNIPMSQRRLICHIAQTLDDQDVNWSPIKRQSRLQQTTNFVTFLPIFNKNKV